MAYTERNQKETLGQCGHLCERDLPLLKIRLKAGCLTSFQLKDIKLVDNHQL
jgi:hypothetical protein